MEKKQIIEEIRFFEDQLFEARSALFTETNLKRIKFLQNKIKYLDEKVRELKEVFNLRV